jgi:hypothetical protein
MNNPEYGRSQHSTWLWVIDNGALQREEKMAHHIGFHGSFTHDLLQGTKSRRRAGA